MKYKGAWLLAHGLACMLTVISTQAQADDADNTSGTVPAYDRPAFGFATSALPLGGFAVEQGLPDWSLMHQDGVRTSQFMADSLLRVGLGNGLELQAGSTPFNELTTSEGHASQHMTGRGDTLLGLKIAPPPFNAQWSGALLATVELPDGADALRLPQRQYTLGVTLAQQLDERRTLGYFAQWQRMGTHGTYQLAGNYGYSLNKTWAIYGELVALHQQARTGGLIGAGVTYLPNARLQWDLSFDRGFVGTAPAWVAGFGVAFYFGK
ncbi:transporter [Dyella sp.]|uniref:transporter n=1 Tax=Dyella sp. TaxID=1869338 RepID=UPI002FDB6DF8